MPRNSLYSIMKKYLRPVILLAILILPISCGNRDQTPPYYQPHIGVWEDIGAADKKTVIFFREDGTGSISFDYQDSDFEYVFYYSKKPVWLDLIYSREGKPYRAKIIVKFLDNNQLKWRTFYNDKRPTEFIPKDPDNTIILNRVHPIRDV